MKRINSSSQANTVTVTEFQRKVLQAAYQIPLGQTRSYAWVARRIGKPRSARAVGRELHCNPVPLFIPCHRVIHQDGSLGGYVFGSSQKLALLRLEQEICARFSQK